MSRRLSFPELFDRLQPHLELKGNGQPDHEGWVTARCVDATNHRNGDSHFSLRVNRNTGGVKCMSQGCIVGNLNDLAERLGLNGQEEEADGVDPVRRLANERMLQVNVLRGKYAIRAAKGAWAFSVDDAGANGHPHFKHDKERWLSEDAPKNWWPKNGGVKASDLVYNLSRIDQDTKVVYVAAGEVDCITLQEAGFPAVSFLAG